MKRKEMIEILARCVARGEISDEAADAVLNEFEDYILRSSIPLTYAEMIKEIKMIPRRQTE